MPEALSTLTKWDIVLVIITLLTLIGIVIGWVERLAKPLTALNSTNIKLVGCVDTLQKQLDKIVDQNCKEHDEIWEAVGENAKAITAVDKRVVIVETKLDIEKEKEHHE